MGKPIAVTDDSFQQTVLEAQVPTLVDFWAVWCGPCKMIAPILDEIAEEYDGKMAVVKLDVDTSGQTAMSFGVMGIPTLILFKNGQVVERMVGFMPKAKLLAKLTPHL